MISHMVVFPTIEVEVLNAFHYGGRALQVGESLWMTENDLRAYAGSVRVLCILSRRSIQRRIDESDEIAGRLRR